MIKEHRIKKGYTQEELSILLNISLRHYCRIENYENIPNFILAMKICELLDIIPLELYNFYTILS